MCSQHRLGVGDKRAGARLDYRTKETRIRESPGPHLLPHADMAMRWDDEMLAELGNYLQGWVPRWTCLGWPHQGRLVRHPNRLRQWSSKLPYYPEQAPMYVIDLHTCVLYKGSRWKVWPEEDGRPWQLAVKSMGCPATAPAVVRELRYARGDVCGADLEGLVSALAVRGSAVLCDQGRNVLIPRTSTCVCVCVCVCVCAHVL